MVEVNRIRRLLGEKRRELVEQLDAIDKAIAALGSADATAAEIPPAEPEISAEPAPGPQSLKPRRVLSDAHKAAVSAGKRRARAARDAAKGLAREMPDDSFVPAIRTRGGSQPPRLVKRPIKT